jgi:transposase
MGSIIVPVEGAMELTKTELMELQRQASARNGRADAARRARLILLLSEGRTWAEIRAKLDCSDSYIDRSSKRFAADRLAGLFARHAGRERYKVTDRIEARVLARTTKHKPADGSTHWSTRKLAAALGGDISHMTVAASGPSMASSRIGSRAIWPPTTRSSKPRPPTSSGCT